MAKSAVSAFAHVEEITVEVTTGLPVVVMLKTPAPLNEMVASYGKR